MLMALYFTHGHNKVIAATLSLTEYLIEENPTCSSTTLAGGT